MRLQNRALIGGCLVAAALALSGCGPTDSGTSQTTSSPTATPMPSASASATTTPSATPAPEPSDAGAVIPADCAAVAALPAVASLIAGLNSIDPPAVPVMTDAELLLGCGWIVGDATGALISVSRVDIPTAQQTFEGIVDAGANCDAYRDGSRCVVVTPRQDYPVDTTDITFFRDDLWIEMTTSNLDPTAAFDDIVTAMWG